MTLFHLFIAVLIAGPFMVTAFFMLFRQHNERHFMAATVATIVVFAGALHYFDSNDARKLGKTQGSALIEEGKQEGETCWLDSAKQVFIFTSSWRTNHNEQHQTFQFRL
jgi:glycerol uptake facilitator-like aquaporin